MPERGPRDTELKETASTSRSTVEGHTSEEAQLLNKTKNYNKGIIFKSAVKAQKRKRLIDSTYGMRISFTKKGMTEWALKHG